MHSKPLGRPSSPPLLEDDVSPSLVLDGSVDELAVPPPLVDPVVPSSGPVEFAPSSEELSPDVVPGGRLVVVPPPLDVVVVWFDSPVEPAVGSTGFVVKHPVPRPAVSSRRGSRALRGTKSNIFESFGSISREENHTCLAVREGRAALRGQGIAQVTVWGTARVGFAAGHRGRGRAVTIIAVRRPVAVLAEACSSGLLNARERTRLVRNALIAESAPFVSDRVAAAPAHRSLIEDARGGGWALGRVSVAPAQPGAGAGVEGASNPIADKADTAVIVAFKCSSWRGTGVAWPGRLVRDGHALGLLSPDGDALLTFRTVLRESVAAEQRAVAVFQAARGGIPGGPTVVVRGFCAR